MLAWRLMASDLHFNFCLLSWLQLEGSGSQTSSFLYLFSFVSQFSFNSSLDTAVFLSLLSYCFSYCLFNSLFFFFLLLSPVSTVLRVSFYVCFQPCCQRSFPSSLFLKIFFFCYLLSLFSNNHYLLPFGPHLHYLPTFFSLILHLYYLSSLSLSLSLPFITLYDT